MKKYIKIIKVLLLISFFIFVLFSANFVLADEKINSFDVKIEINKDASILVNETIKYDFGETQKHGIYRDIPVIYDTGEGERYFNLEIQNVTRDGVIENYSVSEKGEYISIKIGRADLTINGEHNYTIVYKVLGAINYFENLDELYWNVTGNNWQVPIDKVKVVVGLPKPNSFDKESSCYLGGYGSEDKCLGEIKNEFFTAESGRVLFEGEGLTITADFPKGIVDVINLNEIQKNESNESPISKNILFWSIFTFALAPIITFIIMFLIWRKKGKDSKGLSTIIAEYEPPLNMKPTLVGSLVDEKPDYRDITAGLIYLAEQGFLKIKKLEKEWFLGSVDYELELLKIDTLSLEKIEQSIIELFFGKELKVGSIKNISEFKNSDTFSTQSKIIIKDIYQEMTEKGFFVKNPNKAKIPYIVISICFFILGMSGILSFLILPAIIIIVFGLLMGKKTPLGAETKDHILGFKMFLSLTEKDRIEFHNAPDKNPEQFMKFLPYAIALGVEKKWAKQFESIYISDPAWYKSNTIGNLAIIGFASNISDFSKSVNTGFTLASRSAARGGYGGGGGGFSGGGFGGGGGRSW